MLVIPVTAIALQDQTPKQIHSQLLENITVLVQGFTTYKTFNTRYPVILCIIGNLNPEHSAM